MVGEVAGDLSMISSVPEDRLGEVRQVFANFLLSRPLIFVHRGDIDEAKRGVELVQGAATSSDVQERQSYLFAMALIHRATGAYREALEEAEEALSLLEAI